MTLLENLPSECTADEAVEQLAELLTPLGIYEPLPQVRTLRLWRTKNYLTVAGRRFTRRNLLEVLGVLKLRQSGLNHHTAIEKVLSLDEERLYLFLNQQESIPTPPIDEEPLTTLRLLAKGIMEQFNRINRDGAVVGHTNRDRTGVENTPRILHQAMARLGRHYLFEQQEDRAASVHQLLHLCTTPLSTWAPSTVGELPKYRDAVLIDPTYLVPGEDCVVIAEEDGSVSLGDLIEHHLHEKLRDTLTKLGEDADAAYTVIREFVGRQPMATRSELHRLYANPELNDEAISFVRALYEPVHAIYAPSNHVSRCKNCNALLSPVPLPGGLSAGSCVLAGCNDDHIVPEAAHGILPLQDCFLARPEVLKFWADPAREELRLYDALRKKTLGEKVMLYPHSDWCDVSIGENVGIDVKDYHDPVRLAQRLNQPLGNLAYYPQRIVAVAQRRWSNLYRDRLIEQLSSERRKQLKIMSVSQTISYCASIRNPASNEGSQGGSDATNA